MHWCKHEIQACVHTHPCKQGRGREILYTLIIKQKYLFEKVQLPNFPPPTHTQFSLGLGITHTVEWIYRISKTFVHLASLTHYELHRSYTLEMNYFIVRKKGETSRRAQYCQAKPSERHTSIFNKLNYQHMFMSLLHEGRWVKMVFQSKGNLKEVFKFTTIACYLASFS